MMHRKRRRPHVVYVERGGDSSAKWLFWGAVVGAGLALLYAPRTGEETRRQVQRTLWKMRALTEEKLDELAEQFGAREADVGGGRRALDEPDAFEEADEFADDELEGEVPKGTAREDLERRLAEARARRRQADLEEPSA